MVLTYTHFTCFDDVERWYNQTKPLGGKNNAGLDIRPIGDRARKHERIVKIDDNCYALSDGFHRGDALFPIWYRYTDGLDKPTLAEMKLFAPIIWQRYGQGVETVTVRNGVGPWTHTSRYMFLARHLPTGLSFVQTRVGRQFVRIRGVGTEVFLAKCTHVRQGELPHILAARDRKAQGQATSMAYTAPWVTGTEDKTSLTFRRDGARWELINSPAALPTPPRTVVDKDLKDQYRAAIKAFTDWALTVTPMLNIGDFVTRQEYDRVWKDWMKENPGYEQRSWGTMHHRATPQLFREIVDNPEHPLRIVMVVAMRYEIGDYSTTIDSQARLSEVRSRINSWMNKTLGFVKKV